MSVARIVVLRDDGGVLSFARRRHCNDKSVDGK